MSRFFLFYEIKKAGKENESNKLFEGEEAIINEFKVTLRFLPSYIKTFLLYFRHRKQRAAF